MRLKLDLEDVKFVTTACDHLGTVRWLVVTVNGKQFHVQRRMDLHPYNPMRDRAIDVLLIELMERMLQKVFEDAAAAVPDGPKDV